MIEINPPPEENSIAFAGRQTVFARLQQQILDPPHRHALTFSGHDGMGKTALLKQCLHVFDENLLLVFTSLSETSYKNSDILLKSFINGINYLLNEKNFSLSRVPDIEADSASNLSDWFRDVYLPEVIHIIRPGRRIVWLIDDANELLKFEADFLAYLQDLLISQPQFSIILSISTTYEDKLSQLHPLINPVMVERIPRLTDDESMDLIRQYAPGIDETISEKIFIASGGHPRLLSRFGQTLQKHRAENADNEAFNLAGKEVYLSSDEDLRAMWLKLSRDERLVLTAIASLIYQNPLEAVTAAGIEAWLVETDYLLDIVAINAALRGLDYQDIVSQQQHDGIKLTMGLMQQWLLEQARLDDSSTVRRGQLPLRLIAIVILIIILIVALLFFVPPQYFDSTSIPTATLAS